MEHAAEPTHWRVGSICVLRELSEQGGLAGNHEEEVCGNTGGLEVSPTFLSRGCCGCVCTAGRKSSTVLYDGQTGWAETRRAAPRRSGLPDQV